MPEPKKLLVQLTYADHEGKTKSYQVWKIGKDDQWVTVHQWGKSSVCTEGDGRGGEIKVQAFSSERAADADVEAIKKKKRANGYSFLTPVSKGIEKKVEENLIKVFGGDRAATIMREGKFPSIMPGWSDPKPEKPKAPEKPVARSEEWGAW
jgi:hypothetical protein